MRIYLFCADAVADMFHLSFVMQKQGRADCLAQMVPALHYNNNAKRFLRMCGMVSQVRWLGKCVRNEKVLRHDGFLCLDCVHMFVQIFLTKVGERLLWRCEPNFRTLAKNAVTSRKFCGTKASIFSGAFNKIKS